jgi:hypothetical protein
MEMANKEIIKILRDCHHLNLETEGKHNVNLLGFKPGTLQLEV